jgi:hypothetical protein
MQIKATFFSLAVFLLFASPAQAQSLFGTYAEHTNWGCTNFEPGFAGVNGTTQFTTAGEISYYGDGTAEGVGRFTVTDTSADPGAATSDIGRYECNWTYVVHEIETPDCNIAGPNPAVGPVKCDFRFEGTCTVTSVANPSSVEVIDQVWYGRIGSTPKAKVKPGEVQTPGKNFDTRVLLIERHDANPERNSDAPMTPFNICGKNGTQLKVSESPIDLIAD